MAAALPNPWASVLYADPSLWHNHDYHHDALQTHLAPVAGGTNAANCASAVLNMAVNSPLVVALQLAGDTQHVYVTHSPTAFPNVVGEATPFDERLTQKT